MFNIILTSFDFIQAIHFLLHVCGYFINKAILCTLRISVPLRTWHYTSSIGLNVYVDALSANVGNILSKLVGSYFTYTGCII